MRLFERNIFNKMCSPSTRQDFRVHLRIRARVILYDRYNENEVRLRALNTQLQTSKICFHLIELVVSLREMQFSGLKLRVAYVTKLSIKSPLLFNLTGPVATRNNKTIIINSYVTHCSRYSHAHWRYLTVYNRENLIHRNWNFTWNKIRTIVTTA